MCQKYLLAVVLAHNTCSRSVELINFLRHDFCTKLLFLYSSLQSNRLTFPHWCGLLVTRSSRRAWVLINTSPWEKQVSIHALFLTDQECHLYSVNLRGIRTGGLWSQRNKIQVPVAPFSCATLAKSPIPYGIHFPYL